MRPPAPTPSLHAGPCYIDFWGPLPPRRLASEAELREWCAVQVLYDGIERRDVSMDRDGMYVTNLDGTKETIALADSAPSGNLVMWVGRDPRWMTDMNRAVYAVAPEYDNESVTWTLGPWDDPARGTWVDVRWLCCEVRGGGYACTAPGGCRHEFTTRERYEAWFHGACSTTCPKCGESLHQIYHRPDGPTPM